MTVSAALDDVEKAVGVLRSGGVIAMPTDTLYALSAAARDAAAVRRVFEIKGREAGRALPLFVSGLDMARDIAVLNDASVRLAERFWPGQLTIVVERRPEFESEALAGGETVALRVPDHPVALAVIAALGAPVTGTSANLSGGADPVTAAVVREQIGDRIDLVLDAGPCEHGLASTIVDCTGEEPVILRQGAVSQERIADALRG